MIKKIVPRDLNLLSEVFFINSNILFIFDGKMANNKPSTKKTRPTAIINSFTRLIFNYLLTFGFIDFPKNLKKSLSGDKTSEVSPPIKDFSYACIAL